MSDDEGSLDRSSLVERYLFPDTSTSSERSTSTLIQNDAKFRSRSEDSSRIFHDSSGVLEPGMTRIKNKEIEHGVRIRNVIVSKQSKLIDEKQELNELNSRLDQLVESVKSKKNQNDELQDRINKFRNEILYSSSENQKKSLNSDLEKSKNELNQVSEVSTMAKIRASRSMYELDRLKEKYDEEIRWQSRDHEKIRLLESQRAESLHELNYLKENCESKQKSLLDDSGRNEKLRDQLRHLGENLDREQESRIDIECQIQTILEKKKFDVELHRIMREELDRILMNGSNRGVDPMGFYTQELREIKEKIREDFKRLNEFNQETMRDEYEYKYSKVVEEIEIKRKQADEARLKAEMEDKSSFESLTIEYERNKDEVKNLKLQEFNLNKLLQELQEKLADLRNRNFENSEARQNEISSLYEQINNLKADLSSMLSFSKSLDSEVAVYARLLNQRMNSFVTQTYTFENYENLVLREESTIDENYRVREQNELRRKQQELEENNRRLKELEEQRRRQKELDELQRLKREREEEERRRRQREQEEEERRQREYEELLRIQREEEERRRQEQIRIQREQEEKLRRQREEEERARKLKEEEERLRRQREEEERRQRDYEEQLRRQREEEERLRRQIEEEERVRRLREEEERLRRQKEEEERVRRQREEEERLRRQKEEEERYRIEYEETIRIQREYEERIKYEEEERLRREEQLMIQREYDEKIRRQKLEEEERRRREYEEQVRIQREYEEKIRKQREEEQRRREYDEQIRIQREYEEKHRIQREEELKRKIEYEEKIRIQRELEIRRQKEADDKMQREIEEERRRQKEIEDRRRQKEIDDQIRRQLQIQQEQKYQNYVVVNTDYLEQQRIERELKLKREREEHEKYILEKLRQEQELLEAQKRQKYLQEQRVRTPQPVNCVDNVSTYTKRIIEENHRSKEIFEEHRYKPDCNGNYEKQISIQLNPTSHRSQSHTNLNHNLINNNNIVHKNIVITNINRSQSPPQNRIYIQNGSMNDLTKTETNNKYAIKHKANRYVSGAIGILETSLNGEYIILENLSSNKSVNLKGWYIHRFVPDQNINVTFKFINDTVLNPGEKLKILANRQRSSSMHEGLNRPPRPVKGTEKVITAHNIENWGTYSKFSVTKLINQEGVDKAVLTQSLLKLASSSNLNQMEDIPLPEGSELSRHYRNTSRSTTNLNELDGGQMIRARSASRPCCPETTTTTTTKKTTTTTSTTQQTTTTTSKNCCPEQIVITSKPPIVHHVTRQF